MYCFMLGLGGKVILGRTWEEFLYCCERLQSLLNLGEMNRIVIYVHNLAFEFQFMRKWITWESVFALDERIVVKAVSSFGIEFRCSYKLTNKSLSKVGDDLTKFKISKMVGDLDYSIYRHSKTPLTEKEMGYCINDVRIVMAFIQECIDKDGDITKIPLTKTGYVRNYCRKMCLYPNGYDIRKKENREQYYLYKGLMYNMRINDIHEYETLKKAFSGGYTHSNALYMGVACSNVGSADFTSSYPAVMLSEKFPMSTGEKIAIKSQEEFYKNLKLYCCVFEVKLHNVKSKTPFACIISDSKCRNLKGAVIDNGRIYKADELTTTITNVDWTSIKEFYDFDEQIEVRNFYRYKKGYLPKAFILSLLSLYGDKTKYKGVEGKETEYTLAKENFNACYGMTVTDIFREEIIYDEVDGWSKSSKELNGEEMQDKKEEAIQKYNDSAKRFLFYPWGVFITAYARRNLFTGIKEFGIDYIYSDTDSIKGFNFSNHKEYFDKYNEVITKKIENCLKFYELDKNLACPQTVSGEKKPIGVWDIEGEYAKFQTCGAKRYMTLTIVNKTKANDLLYDHNMNQFIRVGDKKTISLDEVIKGGFGAILIEENGSIFNLSLTISGVNKNTAIPYILSKYKEIDNVFSNFNEVLIIPEGYAGKKVHTYYDFPVSAYLTDYLGNTEYCEEKSFIHLEEGAYSLSITEEFINFANGVKERIYDY